MSNCKHTGRIIRGSKFRTNDRDGADIAWCDDCGQITYATDASPTPGVPRFEDWCDKHIRAFACAAEAHGKSACKKWCGHHESCLAQPNYSSTPK